MSQPILIWGAGTIGGVVGAFLHRAGHSVQLVDIDAAQVAAICDHGLRISGPVDSFTARIPIVHASQADGTWPIVFLAVKAQHVDAALDMLVPRLAADGYVLSLQNGLCTESIAARVGRHRTLGSFVNFAGDLIGPGEIRFGARGTLMVGELDGRPTLRLRALEALLRDFEPTAEATDALGSFVWGKLCFTTLLIAQALGEASIADTLERAELLPLWRSLVGEVVAAARAEGIEPRAFDGMEPGAFVPPATNEATRRSVAELVHHNRQGAKTHSGYWRDLAVHRRRSEGSAQLAPVLAVARRHGLDGPVTERMLSMLTEIEQGRRTQRNANLDELVAAATAVGRAI